MKRNKSSLGWYEIACDGLELKKCRQDPRFPYLVTLARATNALNLWSAILPHIQDVSSPAGARDIWNSFFFTCAILYEALDLTRKMGKAFVNDAQYQNGIRKFLKDPRAKRVEHPSWKPVRNHAVFHFDPNWFSQQLEKADFGECIFVRGEGKSKKGVYYPLADEVALESLVGLPIESEDFEQEMRARAKDTTQFAIEFANEAEMLIGYALREWGFKFAHIPSGITSSKA